VYKSLLLIESNSIYTHYFIICKAI